MHIIKQKNIYGYSIHLDILFSTGNFVIKLYKIGIISKENPKTEQK